MERYIHYQQSTIVQNINNEMSSIKNNKVEVLYTISVVLAFALLFFANADRQEAPDGTIVHLGIGKAFYFPCGIALACSFYMHRANDKMNQALNWLIALALISTLMNLPSSNNVLEWTATRFVMAILCFRDIRIIDPKRLVLYITYAAPFIIIPHYILTNPFGYGAYRYAGFYGDPNFLAIALNLIITMCYLSFKLHDKHIVKFFASVSVIGAIPLILVGVSRGGILGLIIILYFIGRDIFKSSKIGFITICIVGLTFSGSFIAKMGDTLDFISARFSNESSSDAGGARARMEGIESSINVFINHPSSIPLGIGPGQTVAKIQEYRQYGYYCRYAIHNTFFSLLYEMGVFAFIFYLSLFKFAYKHLKSNQFYLLIGLLASNALSLFTLPGGTFMPSWILLFFVTNYRIAELQENKPLENGNSNLIHLHRQIQSIL